MSEIVTTREFQRGDDFAFTVAAKNGYGIKVEEITSMQEYLAPDSETIEWVGNMYPGTNNNGLYPAVKISGTLSNSPVNYSITSDTNGVVHELEYVVKFVPDDNPITHQTVEIELDGMDLTTVYRWLDNPLILQTPTIIPNPQHPEDNEIIFTVWHCINNDTDYVAGSRIYVNSDMSFEAKWAVMPVSVGVESDTESSTIPEFENE